MIKVDSLSRRYGKTTVVDDVSFTLGGNQIVGLLGHNGAGKTTIMRMLSGYLEPSAGSIEIDGIVLAANAHDMQRQLGYLPENLPIYPDMLVADYLDYTATLKGIERSKRAQAIREAIAATDLTGRILDPISTLSRGLRQRVGVAQAVLGKPRFLILDEPTNGLDPEQTGHMRELIQLLSRRATIILSTHIMQEVEAVCDRVLVLRSGRLALDNSLAELSQSRTVRLRTEPGLDHLGDELRQIPGVSGIEHSDKDLETGTYHLHLAEDTELDTAAHQIARRCHDLDARIYRLEPLRRSLETVLREVSSGGD